MAGTGLAYFFAARYAHDGAGNVTYQDGREFAGAIQVSTDIKQADANTLYVNNAAKENANVFASGTLSITTDHLGQNASRYIMGIELRQRTLPGGKQIPYLLHSSAKSPELGFGTVLYGQVDGVRLYTAVVLPKISFNIAGDSAKTQGESIEWQTPELTANIMRDDTPDAAWKYTAECEREEDAIQFVKSFLGIIIEPLSVACRPGTDFGKTSLVVMPPLTEGRSYVYKTGPTLRAPTLNAVIGSSYAAWNGAEQVAGKTGEQILVVEIDADHMAKRAGVATIRAKEEVLGQLTITSTAGSSAGFSKITVSPALVTGNAYRYKTGTNVDIPTINQDVTDWFAWDGAENVEGTAGQRIVVVEADAYGRAKKAGKATLTVA